ncbi:MULTISPECIES: helix-turn-helix domain-containing protein [unclassified Neisseria]|uniref:helix-turn-helix domain-containing protein n=1 Tax=unclassified Neisseria TaxID=2623750 RepID=UPI001D168467|nr:MULTISPECIES: helix-turn-helix domain-containing protein [unclassified Neisseria]
MAAVQKRGKTIKQLSMEAGLSQNTLKNALQFSYSKGEKSLLSFWRCSPSKFSQAVIRTRVSLLNYILANKPSKKVKTICKC